jgi:hypothetical protein
LGRESRLLERLLSSLLFAPRIAFSLLRLNLEPLNFAPIVVGYGRTAEGQREDGSD